MRHTIRGWFASCMTVCFLLAGFQAQAAMIGTEELVNESSRASDLATVDAFMAGEQVQAQLESWGVESQQAADRVAGLSDDELRQLATNIDSQPAGGGVLGVVGVVFVVLLILELLGITNVFTAI